MRRVRKRVRESVGTLFARSTLYSGQASKEIEDAIFAYVHSVIPTTKRMLFDYKFCEKTNLSPPRILIQPNPDWNENDEPGVIVLYSAGLFFKFNFYETHIEYPDPNLFAKIDQFLNMVYNG